MGYFRPYVATVIGSVECSVCGSAARIEGRGKEIATQSNPSSGQAPEPHLGDSLDVRGAMTCPMPVEVGLQP